MSLLGKYVLITPARNEAELIESTIESVLSQTARPVRWVIVSDGSTDGTDAIVASYAARHAWIELLRMPERSERHFAGKAHAFNAGYRRIKELRIEYEAIGNLDADVSFDPGYFAYLLEKLAIDEALGLVGTPFQESSNAAYDYRFTNIDHVSGACQLFRKQCFEEIGGYTPVKGGCVDHIVVLSARMNGWKTRTFLEKVCSHHRAMGTAQTGILTARFKNGMKDYMIGNHALWELFRTVYQTTRRPFLIGGLLVGLGYLWAAIRRIDRPISRDLIRFQQREQMVRLKGMLLRLRPSRPRQAAAA